MDQEVVHIAMLGISQGAADEVAALKLAIEMAGAAGHRVVAQATVPDVESAIRVQLASWIIDPQIDVVIVAMDTRSKAVSAAVRPLIVERVPGLIEAARCENTYVIVLLPGASSVKAAMQHRILARLDSRQDGNLTANMPRLRDRTTTDAIPAPASDEQTGKDAIPAPASDEQTGKDAIPSPVEKERTASGAGVPARLPAPSAAMRAAAVPIAAPASAPARKPQATGKHLVSRGGTPHDVQTAPIDLVAMMPQLPPGADQEIDLDKDIPVFLPDPAPKSAAPRTRPPTAPPPGRARPPTAPVQTIPPASTAPRTRPPTAPPPARVRPPTGQQSIGDGSRSRSPTGANRPATLAVAVVPPPRPNTPSGPTRPATPLPRITSSASAPTAAPTSGATKLAEVWSTPAKQTAAEDGDEPRKVLKLKLASPPRQETSQAAIRLSQAWSAVSGDDDEDDDSVLPEGATVADGVADTLLSTADQAPVPVEPKPPIPAKETKQPAIPVAASVTAELDAADVESVDGEDEPDAPSPMAALLSQPAPKPRPRAEEPSFAQSLITPMPRDSARMPVYASKQRGKRTLLVAVLMLAVVGGGVFAYGRLGGDKRPATTAQIEIDAAPAPDAEVAMAADAAAIEEPVVVDAAPEVVAVVVDAAPEPAPEPEPKPEPKPDPKAKTPPKTTPKTTPKTPPKPPDVAVRETPKPPDVVKPPDPPKEDPKPQVAPGCDEVSCVMDNYARACCARYKPAGETFTPKRTGTPEELDKTMIRVGVGRVKPAVIACGEKASAKGTVKIAMVVGPDGSVRGATVAESPDPGLGTCVASALKRAKFQATVKGGTFTYPFVF